MNTNNTTADITTQLAQNLPQLIEWIKSSADQVGKFATEQTPLVIHEYLAWVLWANLFGTLLGAVLVIGSIWGGIVLVRWCNREDNDAQPTSAFFSIPLVIGAVMFFNCSLNLLKVCVAPRIIVLEKCQEIVK